MPIRKRMLPIARRARSKKRMRPKSRKKNPPVQKATPISGGEDQWMSIFQCVLRDWEGVTLTVRKPEGRHVSGLSCMWSFIVLE